VYATQKFSDYLTNVPKFTFVTSTDKEQNLRPRRGNSRYNRNISRSNNNRRNYSRREDSRSLLSGVRRIAGWGRHSRYGRFNTFQTSKFL
jgi:hypothetical protein